MKKCTCRFSFDRLFRIRHMRACAYIKFYFYVVCFRAPSILSSLNTKITQISICEQNLQIDLYDDDDGANFLREINLSTFVSSTTHRECNYVSWGVNINFFFLVARNKNFENREKEKGDI